MYSKSLIIMSSDEFKDIQITGFDEKKTYNPVPERNLYNVYFTLSVYPPFEWGEIFEQMHSRPHHSLWRKAWVEGGHLVIYAPLDEIENTHLERLRKAIAMTNEEYREYLVNKKISDQQEADFKASEQKKIEELKKRLKFD